MQLHRLKLVNFRQHADTDIEFGPGITAVIGANGAGKTTLLEAIAWAFYGNPAARGSRDTIRWSGAPARSPVRVEVTFALGAHEFRVVRGLYNAELYQDRQDAPVANSQQEVTGKVERLLGMSRDEFFNTYFTGQKELAVMATMGPADRSRFLSRVLGYEKLRLAQDRIRDTRSGLRGELQGLERGLADETELERERQTAEVREKEARAAVARAEQVKADAHRAVQEEGPAWTKMVELRESVVSLEGDRRVAERDVTEARREFERLDRELAEALAARQQLGALAETLATVEPLKTELERLEQEAQAAGRRRTMTGELRALEEQLDGVRQRLERLRDAEGQLERARPALDVARTTLQQAENDEEKARTAWVRDRQDAETRRAHLREQYSDLKRNRERVVEAGPEGECPICKRPLGAVYEEMVETLARQLEEVEVRGKYFNQRVEQLAHPPADVQAAEQRTSESAQRVEAAVTEVAQAEAHAKEAHEVATDVTRLEHRRAELQRAIAALPDRYDAERHDRVREELKTLEPTLAKAAELRVKAARAEHLVSEAETAERALSECERRVKELGEAIADLGFSEERYQEARARYEGATERVREAELELASLGGDLKAAEGTLARAQERLAERAARAARLRTLELDLRAHDELDQALSDLRLRLNAAMRPELSERASAFLAELTEGRYSELEVDEQYQILVVEDGIAKPVISGGEEDIANLVLRLAISQMVAERAGQPLSLLVLDEIFGSLDEQRRHNVVELLRHLADRFPQVVLITHIESVREGVDRVLRVALDESRGAAVVSEDRGTDVAA